MSEEITLAEDENDDERLLAALYRLGEQCAYRLRQRAQVPRKAGLLIRYSDSAETRRRLTLPQCRVPAGDHRGWDADLHASLEMLFFKACRRRVRVRFMRVCFWDFSPPHLQLSLFPAPAGGQRQGIRAIHAMDRIRERYGADAIHSGRAAP